LPKGRVFIYDRKSVKASWTLSGTIAPTVPSAGNMNFGFSYGTSLSSKCVVGSGGPGRV
jgi:hypothetical protein